MLGEVSYDALSTLPEPVKIPRSRQAPYYNVLMKGMRLGGEDLNLDLLPFERSYGTILDSGTTFTYLPSTAHKTFSDAFVKAVEGTGRQVILEQSVGTYCFIAYAPFCY